MREKSSRRGIGLQIVAVVAVVFGVASVVAGGRTLFGGVDMGAVVPFVLWFNFLAGFAYVVAGLGLLLRQRWAVWLSIAILTGTVLILLAFGLHVMTGGAFEKRTALAMVTRTTVWAVISAVAYLEVARVATR